MFKPSKNRIGLSTTSSSPTPSSIHLVTGLLVNSEHAWNKNDDRKNESGSWLLNPFFDRLNKTVYISDVLITEKNIVSSVILNRYGTQTWQNYLLKSLSNRDDIDLRPLAQYKKSQECPYYLTYIIDHYYNLPEIILFSHGRPQVHNPHILKHWSWFIDRVQQDIDHHFFNASVGFLSSNCGIYVKRFVRSRPILDLLGYNRSMNPFANQIRVLSVGTYCCAQFIVHRSRILQHSISFWRLALKISIDMNDCSHFEHLWHIFFGESDELDPKKSLAVWYEDAHSHFNEYCPIKVLDE
ncbi:unnamed protein product [Adineta ricciae]|uniref:Uncharacterized protein n=1 Tax=Adineta ricciae TaxID=249248 RepID=A0A814QUL3_ADIRI|nr:unnamed protein product [Adineta ricciae]